MRSAVASSSSSANIRSARPGSTDRVRRPARFVTGAWIAGGAERADSTMACCSDWLPTISPDSISVHSCNASSCSMTCALLRPVRSDWTMNAAATAAGTAMTQPVTA